MQTTYIIGNGFDVNLGIKSSYSDFYHYYTGLTPVKNPYIMDIRKNMTDYIMGVTKKDEANIDWSDLEKALGEYSEKIPTKEFKTVFFDLEDHLMKYLTEQEKQLEIDDAIKQKIKKDFCTPDVTKNFKLGPVNTIRHFKEAVRSSNEIISIVNFNYTSTLENLLDYTGKSVLVGSNSVGSNVFIKDVIHVHRSLSDGDIILGVNDVDQIANQSYKEKTEMLDCLIKPQANANQEDGINERVERVIASSDMIVIFGSSLGETDNMWWKEIGRKLQTSTALLLYFMYSKTAIDHEMYNLPTVIRDKRKELAKKLFIKESQFQMVEKRILIGYRPQIFTVPTNLNKSSGIVININIPSPPPLHIQ